MWARAARKPDSFCQFNSAASNSVVREGRQADKTVIGAHAPFEGLLDGAPSGTAKAPSHGARGLCPGQDLK